MNAQINNIGKTDDEYQHGVKALNERVEALFASDAAGDCVSRDMLEVERGKRIDARAMLMDQFGIDSAFVRIPILARVLNLAPAGIYAAIREDRFFMPHRMMFSVPAVKLDDLVEWYCMDETSQRSAAKRKGDGACGGSAAALVGSSRNATEVANESSPGLQTQSEKAQCSPAGPDRVELERARDLPDNFGETDAERLKRERRDIIRKVRAQMKANLR